MNELEYIFLPYLRKGLSRFISESASVTDKRASVSATVTISATDNNGQNAAIKNTVTKNISLYGPQDVVGINKNMVSRLFPQPDVNTALTNNFSFIEFYDEDFPWRYTPTMPESNRLNPWLLLVTLSEEEFTMNSQYEPLPSVNIKISVDNFPKPEELWAWAHVQVNKLKTTQWQPKDSTNPDSVKEAKNALGKYIYENPNDVYSRILCARKLKEGKRYHSFLIPAYENGRLAGLGLKPDQPLNEKSWKLTDGAKDFPIYYQWSFVTSAEGDLEYYLNKLTPVTDWNTKINGKSPMDIGKIDINVLPNDVNWKFSTIEGKIEQFTKIGTEPVENKVIKTEIKSLYCANPDRDKTGKPIKIQKIDGKAAKIIRETVADVDGDPIVAPPQYGSTYFKKAAWEDEINTHLSCRVVAGLGATLVKQNQEEYMQRAWEQAGSLQQVNDALRNAQLGEFMSMGIYEKHFLNVSTEQFVINIAPLIAQNQPIDVIKSNNYVNSRKVLEEVGDKGKDWALSYRSVTKTLRSSIGRVRQTQPVSTTTTLTPTIINQKEMINENKPLMNGSDIVKINFNSFLGLNYEEKGLYYIPTSFVEPMPIVDKELNVLGRMRRDDLLFYKNYKNSSIFINPRSVDKRDIYGTDFFGEKQTGQGKLAHITLLERIKPSFTIRNRLNSMIEGIYAENLLQRIPNIDFPEPMSRVLEKNYKDFFCSNLDVLQPNQVCILDVNEEFIESFLVGLNDEMNREMQWREFPTDLKGTYFRQFWDVKDMIVPAEHKSNELEWLKDIRPILDWKNDSLGKNYCYKLQDKYPAANVNCDNPDATVALVIKSDLLKKYPNTMVYAMKKNGKDGSCEKGDNSLKGFDCSDIRTPLFTTRVAPDIYFMHFNISVEDIRKEKKEEDKKWYFFFAERVGDVCFGIDLSKDYMDTSPNRSMVDNWDMFSLDNFKQQTFLNSSMLRLDFLQGNDDSIISRSISTNPNEKIPSEDAIKWGEKYINNFPKVDSAKIAYMLFQKPVKMAIEAKVLIPFGCVKS
jgi:hypothetical protein